MKVYEYLAWSLKRREEAAKAEQNATQPRNVNKISAAEEDSPSNSNTFPTGPRSEEEIKETVRNLRSREARYFDIDDDVEDKHALMHVTEQQRQRMSRRCYECNGIIPFYEDFDSDTYAPPGTCPENREFCSMRP